MAKNNKKTQRKTESTPNYLAEVRMHYDEAHGELTMRAQHKSQGFDEYDNLYRSHIDSSKWPFNSKIFIPLTFKSLYGKDTRLFTGKVKGKLVAGDYGNELGAKIGTELLSSQYDDHDNFFEETLLSKFFRTSQNARKYGAGFGLVGWRTETKNGEIVFDGPTFEPLDNRKVYLQPGAISIDQSDYVIVEREMTLDQLKSINDKGEEKFGSSVYNNLDKLGNMTENTVKKEIESRNLAIRNLEQEKTGRGKHMPFRVLTEYRRDKWITWTPDIGGDKESNALGLVLRVTDNPYKHGKIPVRRLVYIPIDDDIYGVSEIEPGRAAQKAVNALASGFVEAVSSELYPIIKGHPTNVDWKTIEFKPKAAWIMNNPQTDIVMQEGRFSFTRNFVEAYRLLVTTFSEAMGDTAADSSNLAQLATDKTATEIKDLALQRGSRDNLNKLFLSSFITQVYQMWWSMNQQFLTDTKVIRVAGRDAIKYFVEEGLSEYELTQEGYEFIQTYMDEVLARGEKINFTDAYEELREAGLLEEFAIPMYPVKTGGEQLPKLQLNRDNKSGFLAVEQNDMTGQYRFTVDLNTMGEKNEQEEVQAVSTYYNLLKEAEPKLEGQKIKWKELLEVMGDKLGVRDAEQFIESLSPQEQQMRQQQAQMQLQPQGPANPQQLIAQAQQPNVANQQPTI